MIQVHAITKSYGSVQAVGGISFTAPDGAITTLLGANGSGKTTTLRAIAGLIRPDGGRVLVDGVPVAERPLEARRRLGFFPESFGLYPRLTAVEHVAYFGELHGLRGAPLQEAVEETIRTLGMRDIAHRRAEGFSQGQKMKVALARALVHRPGNLVLDEPTRGLDVLGVRLLRQILRDLRRQGRAILMSSHVLAEVEALSDQVVMIDRGRLLAAGSPTEIVAKTGGANLEEAFVALLGGAERSAA